MKKKYSEFIQRKPRGGYKIIWQGFNIMSCIYGYTHTQLERNCRNAT